MFIVLTLPNNCKSKAQFLFFKTIESFYFINSENTSIFILKKSTFIAVIFSNKPVQICLYQVNYVFWTPPLLELRHTATKCTFPMFSWVCMPTGYVQLHDQYFSYLFKLCLTYSDLSVNQNGIYNQMLYKCMYSHQIITSSKLISYKSQLPCASKYSNVNVVCIMFFP